ncbi:hypothetical protein M0805_000570 [Coniferiporia weirii]|nr:hypothetical protein M0805_000570 [Coniferiporia weirii]
MDASVWLSLPACPPVSTSSVELRNGDKADYVGKGEYPSTVNNANNIIPAALIESGLTVTQQKQINDFLVKLDGH